jgi:transcriptional regulator with XRE-family HTH domain
LSKQFYSKLNFFVKKIKALRKKKGDPLRIVAYYLGIDQAILSKIENGKRKASMEQVKKLSKYFNVSEKELTVDWLSDKIIYEIEDEKFGKEALKLAEERIHYKKKHNE